MIASKKTFYQLLSLFFFFFCLFQFAFSSPTILASDREYLTLLQIDDNLSSLTEFYEYNYLKENSSYIPLSYFLQKKKNGDVDLSNLDLVNESHDFGEASSSSLSTIISLSLLWHYRDDHWKQGGDSQSLKYSKLAFDRLITLDILLNQDYQYNENEHSSQICSLFDIQLQNENCEDFLVSTEFKEIEKERKKFIYSLGVHQIRLQILLGQFSEGLYTLSLVKKSLNYPELSLLDSFNLYLCKNSKENNSCESNFNSIDNSCSCMFSEKYIEENLSFNNIYELNYNEYFSSTSQISPSVLTKAYFTNKNNENVFNIDPILSYLYQLEGEIHLSKGGKYSKLYSFHYFIKSFLASHCNHQVFYKLATTITFKSLRKNFKHKQFYNNTTNIENKLVTFSTNSLVNSFPLSSFSIEDILFDILETSEVLLGNSFIENSSIILRIKDFKKLKFLRLKYIINKKKKMFFSKTSKKSDDEKQDPIDDLKDSKLKTDELKKEIIDTQDLPLNLFSYTFPSICYFDQNYDEFDFLYSYSELSNNFDLKIISSLKDEQQFNIIQGTFFWVNFLIYDHFSNFYTENSTYNHLSDQDSDPNLHYDYKQLNQIIIDKLIIDNSKNVGLSWHSLEQARYLDKFRYLTSQIYSISSSIEQTNHMLNYFHSSFWPTKKEVYLNNKKRRTKKLNDEDNISSFFGINSYTPVFIVGFFRSGSTLLETLLDKHPSVWGMGESSPLTFQLHALQDDMLKLTEKKFSTDLQVMEEHKKIIKYHAKEVLNKMNEKFNEFSSFKSSNKSIVTRIVDKMLINYKNIPFIHLLFPNALIINTVRDPIDTLFSCLKNRFGDFSAYTLDFKSLIQEYINYLKIMNHFRNILPNVEIENGITRKPILDVRYETLLISPEKNMKKIFNFMNFTISDEDIHNYYGLHQSKKVAENNRLVKTASYLQVKEPLYLSSIGKWKKYQIYLESSGFLKLLRHELGSLKKNKKFLLPYNTQTSSSSSSTSSSSTSSSSTSLSPSLSGVNWDIDLDFDYEKQISELQKIFDFLESKQLEDIGISPNSNTFSQKSI